jgi:hypothetical protein
MDFLAPNVRFFYGAWFTVSFYMNTMNRAYWSIEYRHSVHELLMHDLNFAV